MQRSLLLSALLAPSMPVLAVDGVIEINQVAVTATTCCMEPLEPAIDANCTNWAATLNPLELLGRVVAPIFSRASIPDGRGPGAGSVPSRVRT